MTIPIVKITLLTKFGNAYGNLIKNSFFPNQAGSLTAGEANAPPRIGPRIDPTCQTRGSVAKAFGCSSLCGTISATVVRKMPTLPFDAPLAALAIRQTVRFFEKPKRTLELMAHVIANSMIGFLPYLSLARPQEMAVKAWLMENTALIIPAHFGTSFLGMLKDSIISGRYGNTPVRATLGEIVRHVKSGGMFSTYWLRETT